MQRTKIGNLITLDSWPTYLAFSSIILFILGILFFLCVCCCKKKKQPKNRRGEASLLLPVESNIQKMKNLLSEGKLVLLHTSKGPKKVKLFLLRNEVRWETTDMMSNKKYKLDLDSVLYIYEGKSTRNLVKVNVSEKLCVSLISESSTLDLQVETQDEQKVLYRGFMDIVASIKKSGGYDV
jgi:hypothetical protein